MKLFTLVLALVSAPASAGMTVGEAFREAVLQAQVRAEFQRELARGERLRRENVLLVDGEERPKKEGASGISEGASGINSKSDWDEILRKGWVAWPKLRFPDGESYPLNELCLSGGDLLVEGRPMGKICTKPSAAGCAESTPVRLRLPARAAAGRTFEVFVYAAPGAETPLLKKSYAVGACSS